VPSVSDLDQTKPRVSKKADGSFLEQQDTEVTKMVERTNENQQRPSSASRNGGDVFEEGDQVVFETMEEPRHPTRQIANLSYQRQEFGLLNAGDSTGDG
jgi:hypothetical protein